MRLYFYLALACFYANIALSAPSFSPRKALAGVSLLAQPSAAMKVYDEDFFFAFEKVAIKKSRKAILFIPGGGVDSYAYAALGRMLAMHSALLVVVKPPSYVAKLDIHLIEKIRDRYADIDHWIIGGHSHGAKAAAYLIEKEPHRWQGLFMLAATLPDGLSALPPGVSKRLFPGGIDISSYDRQVLVVVAQDDKIASMDKIDAVRHRFPLHTKFLLSKNSDHAGFGLYEDPNAQSGAAAKMYPHLLSAEAIIHMFL